MKIATTTQCPYHTDHAASGPGAVATMQPPGTWPPGPRAGITGWSLLRSMSRDLLGTLAAWRRDHGDLVHLAIWPEHQIVVTAPELVRELLVTHHDSLIRWERGIRIFSQLHGSSVLTAEGAAWKIKRQALQPGFAPKAVMLLVPMIGAASAQAFARWTAGDAPWPIEQAFNALGMDVILRTMFSSASDSDTRMAERAVHDSSVAANAEMYWPASWPDWMPWKRNKRRARRLLTGLIERHVAARLALPAPDWPDDVLSRLLALHQGDPVVWSLQAVCDECMTAFLAGHETSAATLTWWAWCMASNPAAQAAAQAEVDAVLDGRMPTADDLPKLAYVHRTIQETMRIYPAAPVLLSRRATRPITLGGWQLPAGTMFMVPQQLMQHDARWFDEPMAFRPERFDADGAASGNAPRGAYMPLGTGPRVCLGQHLAMTEMTVIAAMLLQRFRLTVPAGMAAPVPKFHITLRPDVPLALMLQRR